MKIDYLALSNYRNFTDIAIDNISDGINIIYGKNAVGKTNLIEAINYTSCSKSFRSVGDQKLIKDGTDKANIFCKFSTRSYSGKVDIGILGESKKKIILNGLPIKKVSELLGVINTIVFTPEDLKIVKESPSIRRRMIDVELCKINKNYYINLQNYIIALKNKNKLLKESKIDKTLIDIYSHQMSEYGFLIYNMRKKYLSELNDYCSYLYNDFLDIGERISIRYKSMFKENEEESQQAFYKKITDNIHREIEFRQSLIGIHRDDMLISINDKDSKIYASQGQQRTAVLALKIASMNSAEINTGEKPILLLDDVFSELDVRRRERLLKMVEGNQVFITSADSENIKLVKNASYFEVSDQQVVKKQ